MENGGLPASTSSAFSWVKSSTVKYTSPRTSRKSGRPLPFSWFGMLLMVLTFGVTSSPVRPSPRVAPRTSRPFSYTRSSASPSTLSSHRNPDSASSAAVASRSSRFAQDAISSAENALSRLSIRAGCWTGVNRVEIALPTFCVGESGVRRSGYCSSSFSSSRISLSNSASETVACAM